MKSSPIQVKQILYGEFCIEPNEIEDDDVLSESFDWNGVLFKSSTRYEKITRDEADAYALFLTLEIASSDKKQAPYSIKASVMGLFAYVGERADSEALDLVVVNGLSILYSSLRESILGMTTRMINGPLCLPGANFMDHAPSATERNNKPPSKKKSKGSSKKVKKD